MPSTRKRPISPKPEHKTPLLELRLAPFAKKVIQQAVISVTVLPRAILSTRERRHSTSISACGRGCFPRTPSQ
jgi:hypothetical protein